MAAHKLWDANFPRQRKKLEEIFGLPCEYTLWVTRLLMNGSAWDLKQYADSQMATSAPLFDNIRPVINYTSSQGTEDQGGLRILCLNEILTNRTSMSRFDINLLECTTITLGAYWFSQKVTPPPMWME